MPELARFVCGTLSVVVSAEHDDKVAEIMAARAELSGELAGVDLDKPESEGEFSALAKFGATAESFKRYGQKRRTSDEMAWNNRYNWSQR